MLRGASDRIPEIQEYLVQRKGTYGTCTMSHAQQPWASTVQCTLVEWCVASDFLQLHLKLRLPLRLHLDIHLHAVISF